ncbi:MAG: glycosyltransferase family 2 protein [Rhodospirillales bacterium]|nr:glycosyltransferase family 2 protein [Rhodospirillales bacterium]
MTVAGAVPLVTIGLSCYNAADTIVRAIDGAARQDWPNLEIVIVDDGSKDESVSLVRRRIETDPRCRLIVHAQNRGFPGALNTLIEQAKGAFIAVFDDDDESRPDRVRVQVEKILAYEKETGAELVACYASGVRRYENGHEVLFDAIGSRPRVPVGQDIVNYHLYMDRDEGVFYGAGTPSCALMARKETFLAVGPYDLNLPRKEDCDFAVRLGLKGGHFIGCPERIVTQYASDGQDKRPEMAYQGARAFIEKYRTLLEQAGRYDYALAWAKMRYYHFQGRPFHALGQAANLVLRHPRLTSARLLRAAPARLHHEWNIRRKKGA